MQAEMDYISRQIDLKLNNQEASLLAYLKDIDNLVSKPVMTMHECEGDMWLSDYRDLNSAVWRIKGLVEKLEHALSENSPND
jgi:hypothetical protein|tara:strand:- start:1946 stop:2191 length:246 start_codon:yes stop_codon:yes gene_type:complete